MKRKTKRASSRQYHKKRNLQPRIKRILAFFVVLVLIGGFGIICVSFAKSSSAVLGAHIVITK